MDTPTPIRPDATGKLIPSLRDVVGRLRHMADVIERGDYGVDSDGDPVSVRTLLVTTYSNNGEIRLHAFGEACTMKTQVVGILALAQRTFTEGEGDISRGEIFDDKSDVVPIR
jgi:hypothetical protein